jgi:hypothetical protein
MDISHSLVAVGQDFAFPINFSCGKHWELTSSASTVVSYSKELATRLSACRDVAELLVKEARAYHREYIYAHRPNPFIFILLVTLFLRDAPSIQLRLNRWLTSCNLHLQVLGASLLFSKAHPMNSSTAKSQGEKRRNMSQTCHLTHPN